MTKIVIKPDPEPLVKLFDSFTEDFKIEFTNRALNAVAQSYLKSVQNSDIGREIKNTLDEKLRLEIFGALNKRTFSKSFLEQLDSAVKSDIELIKQLVINQSAKVKSDISNMVELKIKDIEAKTTAATDARLSQIEQFYESSVATWLESNFKPRVDAQIAKIATAAIQLKTVVQPEEYAQQLFNEFGHDDYTDWNQLPDSVKQLFIERAKKSLIWFESRLNA